MEVNDSVAPRPVEHVGAYDNSTFERSRAQTDGSFLLPNDTGPRFKMYLNCYIIHTYYPYTIQDKLK